METYPGVATQAFLDGLLPEGWARDRLADIARLPRSDTFGLLAAIGREYSFRCAQKLGRLDCATPPQDLRGPREFRSLNRSPHFCLQPPGQWSK